MLFIIQEDASDPFNLNELLDELSRKQKEELWQRLKKLLTEVLLESPVEGWQAVEAQEEGSMETDHNSKMVVLSFKNKYFFFFLIKDSCLLCIVEF